MNTEHVQIYKQNRKDVVYNSGNKQGLLHFLCVIVCVWIHQSKKEPSVCSKLGAQCVLFGASPLKRSARLRVCIPLISVSFPHSPSFPSSLLSLSYFSNKVTSSSGPLCATQRGTFRKISQLINAIYKMCSLVCLSFASQVCND